MLYKLIGEVKGIFNKITLVEFIVSIIFILVGFVFLTKSEDSNTFVSIICGILLIISGLSSIYSFIERGKIVLFYNNFIYGLLFIIVGLLVIIFKNIMSVIVGIYLIIIGVQRINYGILLKKFNESSWLINSAMGLFIAVIGLITMFTDKTLAVKTVGLCILFFGIINLVQVILFRRRSKYFIA